jgi:hypothetical protein
MALKSPLVKGKKKLSAQSAADEAAIMKKKWIKPNSFQIC